MRTHSLSLAALVASATLGLITGQAIAQGQAAEKLDRAALNAPEMRRPVEEVPPQLRTILKNWERASGQIQKLEGQHHRFVYENTFGAAKQARGNFYFEAPDRGRIDIYPDKIPEGGKTTRINPKTNKPYDLTPDQAEIWIADGENVLQIDPTAKSATLWEIPEEKRGANIMNGPLPFLFGLPADQAIERFQFTLVDEEFGINKDTILLQVYPRWESDAENWREARILLNKNTFLPAAVELSDPGGNQITAYSFVEFRVNEQPLFKLFQKNPFKFPLRNYQVKVHAAGPQHAGAVPQAPQGQANGGSGIAVPSVVGLPYEDAQIALKECGLDFALKQGPLAPNPDVLFHVQEQRPAANTRVKQGEMVFLFLYDQPRPDKPEAGGANKPEARTTAKPRTGAVR